MEKEDEDKELLKEIDENEKKIEWTLKQLKPGKSNEARSKEAIDLLNELEENELALEKQEVAKKNPGLGERITQFYISFFGSLFFVIVFIIFICGWIGLNYYMINKGENTAYNLTLLNSIMIALAVVQLPFIIISIRMMQKEEKEKEEVDYERERISLKLQTLNAEEIKDLEFEHRKLTNEHESLMDTIARIQKTLDAINGELGGHMRKHEKEIKDEDLFENLRQEAEDDGRAKIIEKDLEIKEGFMNDFKKEIETLKKKEKKAKKKKRSPAKPEP